MLEPGASRSTWAELLENAETASALVVEPTVTAVEMQPGAPTPAVSESLPDEITVATRAARRLSISDLRASPSQALVLLPPPRLMLTATTLSAARRSSACCKPRIWSDVKLRMHGEARPELAHGMLAGVSAKLENTFTARMFASGAMPKKVVDPVALPAAIPATCVP